MKIISEGQLVAILSALATGLLALIPAYQKWREVRREQAAADHAAGVDPPPTAEANRRALIATAQSWQTWVAPVLGAMILGGLVNNYITARNWLDEWRRRVTYFETRVEDVSKRLEHNVEQNDRIQRAVDRSVEQNDQIHKDVTHSIEQNDHIYKAVDRINLRHDEIKAAIDRIEGRLSTTRPRESTKKKSEQEP